MQPVTVLLPLPFDHGFTYAVPDGLRVQPGDYVRVPFGSRRLWGLVWGQDASPDTPKKFKTVIEHAAHIPPMAEAQRKFLSFLAAYTLTPLGNALKLAMPPLQALEPPAPVTAYRLAENPPLTSPARKSLANALAGGAARTAAELAERSGASRAAIRAFAKAGGLVEQQIAPPPTNLPPLAGGGKEGGRHSAPTLTADQSAAAQTLVASLDAGFSVTVLEGVTGSGKTEVYFEAIAALLSTQAQGTKNEASRPSPLVAAGVRPIASPAGRAGANTENQHPQVLVLLPEIALSAQWLERFTARFGFAPEAWHSAQTPAKKREAWKRVASGRARVVVGARSALFLPFRQLSLIVVDEEHDPSYKQEDGVIYQARDMAVARAREEAAPILLASATPSLETVQNIRAGRYRHLLLPSRYAGATLPAVRLVDMRQHKPPAGQFLSDPLRAKLLSTLADGQQSLLFLNRRGYAPLLLCRACGHRFGCPHCDAWLVLHQRPPHLQCHHCGFRSPAPKSCPECSAEDGLIPCGPGVDRITEEVRRLIPQARLAVLSSDDVTLYEAAPESERAQKDEPLVAHKRVRPIAEPVGEAGAHANGEAPLDHALGLIERGEIDIIIGTQMLAKGHHFPNLTLVGVVDADLGLSGGDLRASERTYQLLEQVAGRAGRAALPGEVWLQSYQPTHPVLQALASGAREAFIEAELDARQRHDLPPYIRMAAIILDDVQESMVERAARALARSAPREPGFSLLGPAPAPISPLRGRYRWRLLLKCPPGVLPQPVLRRWLAAASLPDAVRVKIDIDPYSFL